MGIIKYIMKLHSYYRILGLCNEFKLQLAAIREIVKKEEMPKPTKYKKRCRDCCFLNLCMRV